MGIPIQSLFPLMEGDEAPANWLLFKTQRSSVPRPWQNGTLLLMDMEFEIPPSVLAALMASETGEIYSVFAKPTLMMTEHRRDDYCLGSGWAFMGGLNPVRSSDKQAAERAGIFKRVRFLTYAENRKASTIISYEVAPGTVVFTKVSEADGRHNMAMHGVVDTSNYEVRDLHSEIDSRHCDICRGQGLNCEPKTCPNQQMFLDLRTYRQNLFDQYHGSGVFGNRYTVAWLQGSWTIKVDPNLEPMYMAVKCHTDGDVFEDALIAVLQFEIASIHPPRSTYRFCQILEDELNMPDVPTLPQIENPEPAASDFIGNDYVANDEVMMPGSNMSEPSMSMRSAEEITSPGLFEVSGINSSAASMDGGAASSYSAEGQTSSGVTSNRSKTRYCEICNTSFRRKYDLDRHRDTVHLKLKDKQCPMCSRSFSQTGHLNEHVRVVHGGQNLHKCDRCDRKFGAKSKLMRHIKSVHENQRPFFCIICQNSYKERSYLKQHLTIQHAVSNGRDLEAAMVGGSPQS